MYKRLSSSEAGDFRRMASGTSLMEKKCKAWCYSLKDKYHHFNTVIFLSMYMKAAAGQL